MVMTSSSMMPLGTEAPNFNLLDVVSNKFISIDKKSASEATLIMFICNHCPYVKHILNELVRLVHDYEKKGIAFFAINSNDIEKYPQDSPEKMCELAANLGNPFPYLFDESQEIAKAFGAACTPDFFLFDKDFKCVYRGQLDDSRPGDGVAPNGRDIRNAFDAILQGSPINPNQKSSVGCNIKWK